VFTAKTSGNAMLGDPSLNAFQVSTELNLFTRVSSQLYPRCLRVRAIFLLSLTGFCLIMEIEVNLLLIFLHRGFGYSKVGNYRITITKYHATNLHNKLLNSYAKEE